MRLLQVLTAERPSAAGGTARIYRRGTTTAATTYTTFAGGGASSSSTPRALDGYGIARLYVNELVDVTVYDSTGVAVFGPVTDGENATGVEIIHPHVTGTSYADGSSGLGKPSTFQLLLDKIYTSLGADDFKVLSAGTARYLKDAVTSGFYDVRSTTYGATGDGATDDTQPIQNAINAAVTAGGGIVFFPPGTYKLTAPLTGVDKITLLGVHPSVTTLKQYTSGVVIGSTLGLSVEGLAFAANTGINTAITLATTASVPSNFANCTFARPGSGTTCIVTATGIATFTNCIFNDAELAAGAGSSQKDVVTVNGGLIITSAVNVGDPRLLNNSGCALSVNGVGISATGATSSCELFNSLTTGNVYLNSCNFFPTGGTTLNLLVTWSGTVPQVIESNCIFGSGVVWAKAPFTSMWRDNAYLRTSGSATSYTPDFSAARHHEVISTGASFQFATPTNPPGVATAVGALVLRYKNTNGGAITPTFSAAYKVSTAPSVASGSAACWHLVYDASLTAWVQIGSVVAYAS